MEIKMQDIFERPSVGLKIPSYKMKTIEQDGSIGECNGLGFEYANSDLWKKYELNERSIDERISEAGHSS